MEKFFNKSITLKRKASATGDSVEAWVNEKINLRCCIYSLKPQDSLAMSSYIQTNVTHRMFCWSSEDIQTSDKIVDGSNEYLVKRKPSDWLDYYEIFLCEVA